MYMNCCSSSLATSTYYGFFLMIVSTMVIIFTILLLDCLWILAVQSKTFFMTSLISHYQSGYALENRWLVLMDVSSIMHQHMKF